MSNRYVNAFVKTALTVVGLHVIFLIAGALFGTQLGWANLPMIWAHWQDGISIIISFVLGIALYCGIFAFCTTEE